VQDTRPPNRKSIDELGAYAWLVTESGGNPRDYQLLVVQRRGNAVATCRALAVFCAAFVLVMFRQQD